MKNRSEISKEDQWNVETLYTHIDAWEKELEKLCCKENQNLEVKWPDIASLKGSLKNGAQFVLQALEKILDKSRLLEKLYTFAHLKHDEDIVNEQYKSIFQIISSLAYDFQKETAWFEPELLSLSEETLASYLKAESLSNYRFYLDKIVRNKPHTLSAQQEELIAMANKVFESPPKAFSAYNNADIKFGTIKNENDEDKELSHGLYQVYLREPDRKLRENAFKRMHCKYSDMENTLSELISGLLQSHLFNARARNYKCCLEAALFPKNIPLEVYHSLIKAVREGIGSLHRYLSLRKKILHLDSLHIYDLYVPLVSKVNFNQSYEEAEKLIIESVAPLGQPYQSLLAKGLQEEKWVDRYENKGKRSGAYSSGCYDSYPYILMNFRGTLKDTFTLAHEAGHSMHSLLSHRQPYHYANYPIFLAEVASTFNEELLMDLLMKKVTTKEEKCFLINEKIEDIRGTLFRQTMFAEYELKIHEYAEQNVPLTPQLLKQEYRKLNEIYFGKDVVLDKEIDIEWARIPHFYYNFYVYQYATGISAALSLSEKVLHGSIAEKQKAQEAYLQFLQSGGSLFPIDLLKIAGIDMTSSDPVKAAIKKFDSLVQQLEAEL